MLHALIGMMNLRDTVAECLLGRFERQRLVQVLPQMPRFGDSGENIHQQADIDETSIESDVGNIADPDLILMRDLKVFEQVAPRFIPLKRFCGLGPHAWRGPRDYYLSSIERHVECQWCIRDARVAVWYAYIRISDTRQQVSLFQRAGRRSRTDPLWVDNRNCYWLEISSGLQYNVF